MWKRWIDRLQQADERSPLPRRELACAVLLLECARADFEHHPIEIDAVRKELAAHFGMAQSELDMLLEHAGHEARKAVSLHAYVERFNRELHTDDKRALMAMLWRVACADGRIDAHEEHLLRKLADLLHLPHAEFIRAKLAALGENRS